MATLTIKEGGSMNEIIMKFTLLHEINKAVNQLDDVAFNRLDNCKLLTYTEKIKLEAERQAYKKVFEIINRQYK